MQRELLGKLGVAEEKVSVIPNEIDADKYCRVPPNSPVFQKLRAEFKAQHIFVYQGRIATEKNVESLLRAWKQADMGMGFKVTNCWRWPLKPSLEQFYGEEQGIIWLGAITDENRRIEILQGADVLILPFLVEGLSLFLLEAMACGAACVATDAGADGEVLEDEAGVVLNTQGVAGQLRTLLPQLRDHQAWRKILAENAIKRIEQRYTLDDNIDAVEKLYLNLLKLPKPIATGVA